MSDAFNKLASGEKLTDEEWAEVAAAAEEADAERRARRAEVWCDPEVEDRLSQFRTGLDAQFSAPEGLPNCAFSPAEVLVLLEDAELEEEFKEAIRFQLEAMVQMGRPSMVTAAPISVGREDGEPTHMAFFPLKNGKAGFEIREYDPEEVITELHLD